MVVVVNSFINHYNRDVTSINPFPCKQFTFTYFCVRLTFCIYIMFYTIKQTRISSTQTKKWTLMWCEGHYTRQHADVRVKTVCYLAVVSLHYSVFWDTGGNNPHREVAHICRQQNYALSPLKRHTVSKVTCWHDSFQPPRYPVQKAAMLFQTWSADRGYIEVDPLKRVTTESTNTYFWNSMKHLPWHSFNFK